MMRRWTIRQGTSRATVSAADHAAAAERGRAIGFDAPDAIVLDESAPTRTALQLASPKRADAGAVIAAQLGTVDLPLFAASDQPRLL